MSDEPLFTLREIADQLSLPESTVRYYRDAFLDHIPSVGTGRRRRYPEPALAVLRTIARAYAAGRPRSEILGLVEAAAPAAATETVAPPPKQARRARARETTEVTNLDLLAAIVDGEREQREALWQMAQEIVRLTQVLESQEKVLGELSEHTGMLGSAPEPRSYLAAETGRPPALGQGSAPEPWPSVLFAEVVDAPTTQVEPVPATGSPNEKSIAWLGVALVKLTLDEPTVCDVSLPLVSNVRLPFAISARTREGSRSSSRAASVTSTSASITQQ